MYRSNILKYKAFETEDKDEALGYLALEEL
jgi:hypothetical protein